MIPLLLAVLAASLLGSLHCAGMCGAFLAVACDAGGRRHGAALLNAAYNGGRLISYGLLGALAGLVGQIFDMGGALLGMQRVAVILAAVLMIGFGLITLGRALGWHLQRAPMPAAWRAAVASAHRRIADWSPLARAAGIGLLTALLPCGWLYGFVVIAAGTAHPGSGAAVMGIFWLGTLPVMASLGLLLQRAAGPWRRHLPVATASLLVAVGLFTLAGRASDILAADPSDPRTLSAVTCHGSGIPAR